MGPNRVWSTGHWILSPYRKLVGPVQQLNHINQQVDGGQDGHSQSLVSDAYTVGEFISAVLLAGPVRMPVKLLTEPIEQPEDESATVEKDREQGHHNLEDGEGMGRCPPSHPASAAWPRLLG